MDLQLGLRVTNETRIRGRVKRLLLCPRFAGTAAIRSSTVGSYADNTPPGVIDDNDRMKTEEPRRRVSSLRPAMRIGRGRGFTERAACVVAACLMTLLALLSATPAWSQPSRPPVIALEQWSNPRAEHRPVARWWWPGGSVDPQVVEEQLERIAAAGFGAVELQPLLLGLGDEDIAADPQLRSVGNPAFVQRVASAANAAHAAGLQFDLTLGSGWPGGLPTDKRFSERQLLMAEIRLIGPLDFEGPLPAVPDQEYRDNVEWMLDVLGPPDEDAHVVEILAARIGDERDGTPTLGEARILTDRRSGERFAWKVPEGDWAIFVLYENSTGHFVMGGAYPGAEEDALVVDHLSEPGARALLDGYAAPVLAAADAGAVRALFVDSLELMGQLPFTTDFLEQFRLRAGYELTPYLPLLFRSGGESKYAEMIDLFGTSGKPLYVDRVPGTAERVREDYESVRRALFEERFITGIRQWANTRGLALRLQAHGGYGDYLDTYALADIPESEGLFAGGSFDFLKLASSAAHVAGRRRASTESFITLRLFGNRLERPDMHMLAGRAFSAGINQLVYHGVPYPYTRADGKQWYPFSGGFGRILAGPFPMTHRIDDAELASLADFNLFISRLSLAMTRGRPVMDLAWLRADPSYPDTVSLRFGKVEPHESESSTTGTLRRRGLAHDRVSRTMLTTARVLDGRFEIGAAAYRALLLDPLEVAEPQLVEKIDEIAAAGIPVFTLGALPVRAPGLHEAQRRDVRTRNASERLTKSVIVTAGDDKLETLLARHVAADLVGPADGEELTVSIARRSSGGEEIVLLVNESWTASTPRLRFARAVEDLIVWDPRTGERRVVHNRIAEGDIVEIPMDAAESLVLTMKARGPQFAALDAALSGANSAERSSVQVTGLSTGCGTESDSGQFEAMEVGSCR